MNIKVEALENNQVKLSFEVDAADVDARIKRTYRQVAKRYNFPGFRPGKAPRPVIDNIMGTESVRTTVTEDLVNEVYPQALEEHNLIPLQRPNYEYETDLVEDHKPFNFSATIEVKPSYELSAMSQLRLKFLQLLQLKKKSMLKLKSCAATTKTSKMPMLTPRLSRANL